MLRKILILIRAAWRAAQTGQWWGVIDPADFDSLRPPTTLSTQP